jgi:3-oxoacyl-[acyl-carrier protein] reductase
MSKLKGKVAVVTGASKGIGAGIAKALAAEGASVVVNYASGREGAEQVVGEITRQGGKAVAAHGDVSQKAQIKEVIDTAVRSFGRLDILVNNSGVYQFAPIQDFTEEQFHRQFNVNVLGPLLATQAALPHLTEGASIINISSIVTDALPPASAVYSATKGAVDAITGVLAKELGAKRIRVNAINPGVVRTEGAVSLGIIGSEFENSIVAQTPLGRTGEPEDVARLAVFLASDDARWVTGEHIAASGGFR